MRAVSFIALVVAMGCHAERLTAPEARGAAAARPFIVPDSVVYFIDGVRQPVGATIRLRADEVIAAHVVKDRAARARLFGAAARGGLVYIFTKNSRRGVAST